MCGYFKAKRRRERSTDRNKQTETNRKAERKMKDKTDKTS